MEQLITNQRALMFLRAQADMTEHKLNRLHNALENCEDCLEDEGLQAMLRTAQIERDLIRDLRAQLQRDDALSLDAQIMGRIQRAHAASQRQALTWRRGHPTPAGYWDAEITQIVLNDLLRRFHAWQHGQPLYADVKGLHQTLAKESIAPMQGAAAHAHPWYNDYADEDERAAANGNGPRNGKRHYSRSAEMLYEDITAALGTLDVRDGHLEIIAEPLGQVILTGYAHDDDEKQQIIDTILNVDGVFEVIEDLKVVDPDDCPACQAADDAARSAIEQPKRNGNGNGSGVFRRNGRNGNNSRNGKH